MNRLQRWLFGVFLVVLILGWGKTAVAQTHQFESIATATYTKNVNFHLSGDVAQTVERIDLFLQVAQAERPVTVEVVRISQNEGQLRAEVDVDPTIAALPPFAQVRFWWELQTADGELILVPEETFVYEDDRLNWREWSDEAINVHWTGNDDVLGRLAWEIAADSRQTMDRILPPTAVSPLNVYIYPSTADLRSALRLAGWDWQKEHTDPALGVVLVTAVNLHTAEADLSQSIPHEMAHLRLYQSAPTVQLPRWYEEGLALFVEENNVEREELVDTAVANDTAFTLLTLCTNFPQEAPALGLALAQSASLLGYIQAQFGDQALRQLGAVYLSGADCEVGLSQTLDMSLAELNADWLAAQAPQPVWLTFLSQNGTWLLLLLAGFGLLGLLLRR